MSATIRAKLTVTIKTESGIVLPKGRVGSIVHFQKDAKQPFYLVDFGLNSVLKFHTDSQAIKIEVTR